MENKSDWLLNTRASRHLCSNRELFHDFQNIANNECVFIGKSAIAKVLEKWNILLKLTSGKTLSLSDVLDIASLRRNIVCSSLLNRAGLKIALEAGKGILKK